MTDTLHYQSNLAGEVVPIHDGSPRVGFYKLRRHRTAPWLPVCIFTHEGVMVCRVGADMADPSEVWLQCADNPVPKVEALYAFDHNNNWPSDAPPPIGGNFPPSGDPIEEITRELQAEEARVNAWIAEPHEGKLAADLAANWLAAIRKLHAKTIDAFDAEKAPVLAETQRVDGKWREAKALAASIKKALSDRYDAIARKEQKRLQEIADAKAREEADRKRKEWEAEQTKIATMAQEHNIAVETEPAPVFMPVAEPVKVAFGGAQGARIAPKKSPPKALVENWSVVAAHFSGHAKVRELLQNLANHAAKDGHHIPGVKVLPGE